MNVNWTGVLVMLPVNESVAGHRQQFPAVFIVKGAGAVRELHTSGQSAQTCREDTAWSEIATELSPAASCDCSTRHKTSNSCIDFK